MSVAAALAPRVQSGAGGSSANVLAAPSVSAATVGTVLPDVDYGDVLGQLTDCCATLLARVDEMLVTWTEGEGLPACGPGDILLQTVLARSTRTYRGIMILANEGLGEQARMLARSLFEDMVDAHWVALNPELAVERASQHWRDSQHRRMETAKTFPGRFREPLPPLDPPMTKHEEAHLKKLFRNGTGSWTGGSTRERWRAVASIWEEGMARDQAEFVNAWLHKTSHETLHLSSRSLRAGGPRQMGDDLVFRTGATPEELGVALFCAFWTYAQTLALLAREFELTAWDNVYLEAVEPGYAAFASAGPAAMGSGA
jgi:hypothetical protein